MSTATTGKPFGKEPLAPVWVGVAIALLPPLGIFLLWKHPVLSKSDAWRKSAYAWGALWLVIQATNAFRGDSTRKPPAQAAIQPSAPTPSASTTPSPGRSADYTTNWQEGYRVGRHWAAMRQRHAGQHPMMIAQIEDSIEQVADNYDSPLRMVLSNGITEGPAFDRCQGLVDGFQAGLDE